MSDPSRVLTALVDASVTNTLQNGSKALTGPVSRGDVGTVSAHLAALSEFSLQPCRTRPRATATLLWPDPPRPGSGPDTHHGLTGAGDPVPAGLTARVDRTPDRTDHRRGRCSARIPPGPRSRLTVWQIPSRTRPKTQTFHHISDPEQIRIRKGKAPAALGLRHRSLSGRDRPARILWPRSMPATTGWKPGTKPRTSSASSAVSYL